MGHLHWHRVKFSPSKKQMIHCIFKNSNNILEAVEFYQILRMFVPQPQAITTLYYVCLCAFFIWISHDTDVAVPSGMYRSSILVTFYEQRKDDSISSTYTPMLERSFRMALDLLISSLQRVNNLTAKGWLKMGKEKKTWAIDFSNISNMFNDCKDSKLTFIGEGRHSTDTLCTFGKDTVSLASTLLGLFLIIISFLTEKTLVLIVPIATACALSPQCIQRGSVNAWCHSLCLQQSHVWSEILHRELKYSMAK